MPTRIDKRAAKLAIMRFGADRKRVRQLYRDALVAAKQGQTVDVVEWLLQAALINPTQAAEIRDTLDQTQIDPRAPLRHERIGNDGAYEVAPAATRRSRQAAPQHSLQHIVKHRVLRRIGDGTMGDVYLAYDEAADRLVAIKLLWAHLAANPALVERFKREAEHSTVLNHPNIVRGLGSGMDPKTERYFLVMEYVDGPSLQTLLDQKGKLSIGDAVHVALDVARALEHAQVRNIVHRDIKPENILITKTGVAKLADLGLSKALDQRSDLTAARQAFGTPYYMPFEQAVSARSVDGRSDIFALGATLYHLVTGQVPFKGDTPADVMDRKSVGAYPPASLVNPEVPESLELILDKMLARDPRDRYQTASELIVDLDRSKLASPVVSFVDQELARQDPYYRAHETPANQATHADVQLQPRPPEDLWFLRYKEKDGKLRHSKATTAQVVSAIRRGRLTDVAEASRSLKGPYQPLSHFEPFRGPLREVEEQEEDLSPAANGEGRAMGGLPTYWYVFAGIFLGGVLVALVLYALLLRD